MREIGCSSYQAYYEKIVSGPDAIREWATLVDRLTVQETRFFRCRCLPAGGRLRTDPAPGATGESAAAGSLECWLLHRRRALHPGDDSERMHEPAGPALFGVTGSDISQPAIEKARLGQYSARKLLGMDEDLKARYFRPAERNTVEIVNSIRERVCFTRLNVMDLGKAPMHGMNIIFCQNLLI